MRGGRNQVSRLGPRPCAGRRSAPGSQHSQHHHLSKGLDNKRRALRKSGGRGNSKSPKSLCARRCVFFSPPSTFYEFLEVTSERTLWKSPSGTGVRTHCAPRSRYKSARTAPPLFFPNSLSDGANRGEHRSPAPLPWKNRFPQAATPPSRVPSLSSPRIGQSYLNGPHYSVRQPDIVPAPRTVGMASGG